MGRYPVHRGAPTVHGLHQRLRDTSTHQHIVTELDATSSEQAIVRTCEAGRLNEFAYMGISMRATNALSSATYPDVGVLSWKIDQPL